jgi:hypothetical protein
MWVVSEGIPRTINILCVEALADLRHGTQRKVTAGMIDRSSREQDDRDDADTKPSVVSDAAPGTPGVRAKPKRLRARVGIAAALAILGIGIAWVVSGRAGALSLSAVGPAASSATVSPAEENSQVEPAASEGTSLSTAVSTAPPPSRPPGLPARRTTTDAAPGGASVQDAMEGSAAVDWLLRARPAGGRPPAQ